MCFCRVFAESQSIYRYVYNYINCKLTIFQCNLRVFVRAAKKLNPPCFSKGGGVGYFSVITLPPIASCYFQNISLGFFFISPWC